MNIVKLFSRVLFFVVWLTLFIGLALHSVFEKTAIVYPGTAYWCHFSGALVLIAAVGLELFYEIKNGETKLGIIKALPVFLVLPLVFFVATDPYYVYVNIATLAFFVYQLYRLVFCSLFERSKQWAIVKLLLAMGILVTAIIAAIRHASFEQLDWDIPAGIAAVLCLIAAAFTFSCKYKFLGFLDNPQQDVSKKKPNGND